MKYHLSTKMKELLIKAEAWIPLKSKKKDTKEYLSCGHTSEFSLYEALEKADHSLKMSESRPVVAQGWEQAKLCAHREQRSTVGNSNFVS